MTIELTDLEYRRLLDLVYVGNWILNSARGRDRIGDYDYMESKIFSYAPKCGMKSLVQTPFGVPKPSKAFQEGGIHEAICDYEDSRSPVHLGAHGLDGAVPLVCFSPHYRHKV